MHPQPVVSDDLPPALGPYSHAVRLGDLLFVSGQAGLDPETGAAAPGGFAAEARQAFTNVKRVLEASGSDLGRVAKLTVFMASAGRLPGAQRAVRRVLPVVAADALGADRGPSARPPDLDRGDRRGRAAG